METKRKPTVGEIFDQMYRSTGLYAVSHQVHRDVYGDEYPDEVVPYSFTTRSKLRRIARDLGVVRGRHIADIGCGDGGIGLWVARETGARLTGIDVSGVAVARARERIADFGMEGWADFTVGDFVATGLPDESCDGALSVDVLWAVPDKEASLRDVARILRPGAAFVFTTWDFPVSPAGEPQVADHRTLLHDAGFTVEVYERQADWERNFRAFAAGMERMRDHLVAAAGTAAADASITNVRQRAALLPGWQRVYIAARKG